MTPEELQLAVKYGDNFYLEFSVLENELDSLEKFFAALKESKDEYWENISENDANESEPSNDPQWRGYLNEPAWRYFSQETNLEEEATYNQLWALTAPLVRLTHPMFNRGKNWDFESMVAAIFNGEYTLEEIRRLGEKRAVLLYNPWSYPFGGSECLVVLIESFGHRVTYDFWHEGPHKRGEVGWDYELARKLVSRKKGFVPSD